jgi:hypothetical protein
MTVDLTGVPRASEITTALEGLGIDVRSATPG